VGQALAPVLRPDFGDNPGLHAGSPLTVRPQRSPEALPEAAGLLARIALRDAAALSSLYDLTGSAVHGVCRRILRDPSDAEEASMDVFLQVWEKASRFDPERGDALTWLLTLARSRAIDRLRSRAAARRHETGLDEGHDAPSSDPGPETHSSLAQRAALVRGALADLPAEQREVLELAYFEGLTHSEIAERLSQPLGTAKSRIRLALVHLRRTLEPGTEGGIA
jgi:RNA polymerase sigma-70 factor (ECF subfamily)